MATARVYTQTFKICRDCANFPSCILKVLIIVINLPKVCIALWVTLTIAALLVLAMPLADLEPHTIV
eukprot:6052968-Amphidinium_carterae.1